MRTSRGRCLVRLLVAGLALMAPISSLGAEKPRVIVSTDLGGGDPDDFQSMVHYLIYADRFDTEGLISSPPQAGRVSHILECLAAYEIDYPRLAASGRNYPAPQALKAVARQGAVDPQPADIPGSGVNDGARLIVERAHREDPRPLWVLVWGSITDVAQAVHHDPAIKSGLRVYSIGSWNTRNDVKARDYLFREHPDLWWIENDTTFRGMYQGGDQSGEWSNRGFPARFLQGHGALGALFMAKKADIKMGDSPSVLYLLQGNPDLPEEPHWGGAFVRPSPEARPTYWQDNPDEALRFNHLNGAVTVNLWRRDFLKDWADRMECLRDPSVQD